MHLKIIIQTNEFFQMMLLIKMCLKPKKQCLNSLWGQFFLQKKYVAKKKLGATIISSEVV